jgi:hypothetical protein
MKKPWIDWALDNFILLNGLIEQEMKQEDDEYYVDYSFDAYKKQGESKGIY